MTRPGGLVIWLLQMPPGAIAVGGEVLKAGWAQALIV